MKPGRPSRLPCLRVQDRPIRLERDRLADDVEDAPREPENAQDHAGQADEAELLSRSTASRKSVALGQAVQLLDAAAQALAEDLAEPSAIASASVVGLDGPRTSEHAG